MRPGTKRFAALAVAAGATLAVAAPAGAPAASNQAQANPQGIISSYLGPLGLQKEFTAYRKAVGGDLVDAFFRFADQRGLAIPEGLGGNDLPT